MSEQIELRPHVEIPEVEPEVHKMVIEGLLAAMGNDWTPYGVRTWVQLAYKDLGGVE